MKIISAKHYTTSNPIKVLDCFVDKGYLKGGHGSLPDVDQDFQSDRRQDVKEYTERRYNHDGKQRVFSAGTYSTLKAKAVIKDVARVMRIPSSLANYITAIFDDDKVDYTGIFRLAAQNRKIAKFIADYPMLFEDIRTLMFQPRSSSVHASALLITPDEMDGEDVECFDFVPIKKVDDILVSENSGYDLDELGLLKNDCLATKELSKLHQTFDLVNEHYDANVTMEGIVGSNLDDERVYELLAQGYTQNVFQFSSKGITKFLVQMKPSCIGDLIAANALYRPATLENGAVEAYVNCKAGLVAPTYLWGTYNALKETYAQMVYQEQMVQIAREVGAFSLGEGVKLVKFISKKKIDKIQAMKSKFMEGAKATGCPYEDAIKIWDMIESGGSYLFNKCISGKERIKRPSGHCGRWEPTIAEMYRVMNDRAWAVSHGHKALYAKYHRLGYGSAWAMVDNGVDKPYAIKHYIKDIRYMGTRSVYRITLENGATLDVTLNHKHPTTDGIKRTDELVVGKDKMYYCIGSLKEDTGYRFTNKDGAWNDSYYHEIGKEEMGERGLYLEPQTVVSIEYIGEDEVYDVEMNDPYHTFLTNNNVVTCNSHATAYAVTSYVGAWLKANYPTAFYTVALQWADDKELIPIMSEMEACSKAKVVEPDINKSADSFYTDYETDSIFWSLSRIKQVGTKAVDWIINERNKNGEFTSISNFIDRVFKYKLKKYEYWDDPDNEEEATRCPVNARHVLNLILAGCFDKVEHAGSVVERYAIIEKAAEQLGFEIKEKDFPQDLISKHYFWSQQQIKVSGLGAIDYKRIYDNADIKNQIKGRAAYYTLHDVLDPNNDGKKAAVCATIVEMEEKKFTSKKTGETETFCKIVLQQNNDMAELVVWPDEYMSAREKLLNAKNKLIVCMALIRYSDYAGQNNLQITKNNFIEII